MGVAKLIPELLHPEHGFPDAKTVRGDCARDARFHGEKSSSGSGHQAADEDSSREQAALRVQTFRGASALSVS